MKKKDVHSNYIWNECIQIFEKVSPNNLLELLDDLIICIKNNKEQFELVADISFLHFLLNINAKEYILGTCGDNFEGMCRKYTQLKRPNLDVIWKITSSLVWDLTTMTTDKICPQCKCDHLRLLTDHNYSRIFMECETCFWVEENGRGITRPEELYPATKNQISQIEQKNNCKIVGKI